MKHFKKFFSYLVALTMVLSLAAFTGTKVYADDTTPTTYTLTIKNVIKGHTLKMYQVLTGDLSTNKEGKKVLSNAKWGNGVTSIKISDTETLTANNGEKVSDADMSKLSATNFDPSTSITVNSDDTDSHVYSYNGKKAVKIVGDDPSVVFNTVEAGYYVVTDSAPDDSKSNVKQTETKSIVQIVGDTEIKEKAGTIQSEKKVEDVNDSTGATTTGQESTNLLGKGELGDSADYDIGDSINYTIEAKLPENYAAYDTFPLTFVDTMSKGLTYNAQSAVLHLSGKNTKPLEPTNKSVNYQDPDNSNAVGNATQYKWTITNLKELDSNLKAGDIVYITYSATLNSQAVVGSEGNPNKMHIEFNSNPYSDNTTIKKTPDDTNIVFTYEAVFNKVDQNNKPLTGADFTLYKFVEGTGKDSYKEGDKTYSGTWTDVTTLHNGENKPSKETKANGEAKNATFTFKGIDDGYYKLEETGVPSGYNKMEDKYFTITAGHDILSTDPSLTSLNVTGDLDSITDKTATADEKAGTISANIENKPGSTLPSTGGMGTTLLYVAGGILVACAAAYVVMSRKHSTNK